MRLRYTGTVRRIVRQKADRKTVYPTLVHVDTEIGTMMFQAPADCEDVTGRLVTVTLDVDEAS